MGLRSWITVVSSREQLLETIDFAKNKAYGVSYVLQVTSENAPFPKGTVIVAWSGDGDGSKEDLLAQVDIYCDDIILLENFLDDNPSADWQGGENGPGKYGIFLTKEECNSVEIINVPVSFCVDCMYNEFFNKKFSMTTPVYSLVDNWHKEDKHIYDEDEMCISIPPLGPNANKFDMVNIKGGRYYEDGFNFNYSFNIDVLYSDDENKQEELVVKFEKGLMSNKKQLESILSVNDWVKHYPGQPDADQKVELDVSIIEYDEVINFSLDTPSIDIYHLSKSISIIDLLNNWKKIKDIVEMTLEKIEAKR